ncbi:RNA pseudouridylate synthase [Gracilaria domingensis]|nr:RNA pseudouridylate synthase [Gracilaria domingensis]
MNLAWAHGAPVRLRSNGFFGRCIACPELGKSQLQTAYTGRSSLAQQRLSYSNVFGNQEASRELRSEGIRINKCFTSFASRRQSDEFIQKNRVQVNGKLAVPGTRVFSGDLVTLDGEPMDWERLTMKKITESFHYVKHWKRSDVLCTTDESFQNNIIQEVKLPGISDRLFPVGRLDESSTGLILLTSDGRLPNAVLGASQVCSKTYEVSTDRMVRDEDLMKLREGVVITTDSRRSGSKSSRRVSRTLPCKVRRKHNELVVTLQQGRNRQIRKMLGALGYTVTMIHRVEFMGLTLDGLNAPGESAFLNREELNLVKYALGEVVD